MTNERGITIIETTVILSVLFVLAGVLTPIVSESVDTARVVKAANDAKLIAAGMIQFEKDLGPTAMAYGSGSYGTGYRTLNAQAAAPEVLVTDGELPAVADAPAATPDDLPRQLGLKGPGKFYGAAKGGGRRRWLEAVTGLIDEHLVTNRAGYRLKGAAEGTGWNGPYLSKAIRSDPWGHRYQINCLGLDGGVTAADASGRPRQAVFVVSAGNNGIIETPFDQPIHDARLYGDDIGVRLQ